MSLRRRAWLGAVACLLAAWPPTALAQGGAVAFQRIDVRELPEVAVYFTVVDGGGRSVLGLAPDDLSVTLDDVEQPVAVLRSALAGGEHLALALLFDRSGSMRSGLEPAKAAARDFLRRLSQGDQAAVVAFDDEVTLQAPLTGDGTVLDAAVDAIERGADTALYDAILVGLDAVAEADTPRKAIVVLSDGKDTRSAAERGSVIARARERSVPIFTLGLPVDSDAESLGGLARETGGTYLQAADAEDLRALYQLIAEQLENQYFMRFVSTFGDDGAWHRLAVRLRDRDTTPAERDFMSTTGPGISGGRMQEFERGLARADLVEAAGAGALIGLLFGLLLLAAVKLLQRDVRALTPAGIALVLVASALGALTACLFIVLQRGG